MDYMVMEAVFLKAQQEERDAEKEAKKKNWKKDLSKLDAHR